MSIELHPRPDRDEYVDIHWDNIIPDTQTCYSCNFRKEDASDVMNYGPYDYGSVMHYEWYAFQKQAGLKTISGKVKKRRNLGNELRPRLPLFQKCDCFGQREGMSEADSDKLKHMYSCP